MNLFEFNDYKHFLRFQIEKNKSVRGYQSHLAASARCQKSFFSQVLNGNMDLSRDQAIELTTFWNLDETETEYFVCLVDLARASSERLQRLTTNRLKSIKENRLSLSKQIGKASVTDPEAQMMYYSSWYWMAIHILVSIPKFNNPQHIADRLKLPVELVLNTLEKLSSFDLVSRDGDKWIIGSRNIHLPIEAMMTEVNHANWRRRAVLDVSKREKNSTHYTSVFSMSRDDAEKMRQMILQAVVEWRALIPPSKEEEAYCLCLDFFTI